MSSNLPNWNAADECYRRAGIVNAELCKRAWEAALSQAKGNSKKARGLYIIPEDVRTLISAMDAGDEETIKGINHQYREIWF
jgi:hypothetical protein